MGLSGARGRVASRDSCAQSSRKRRRWDTAVRYRDRANWPVLSQGERKRGSRVCAKVPVFTSRRGRGVGCAQRFRERCEEEGTLNNKSGEGSRAVALVEKILAVIRDPGAARRMWEKKGGRVTAGMRGVLSFTRCAGLLALEGTGTVSARGRGYIKKKEPLCAKTPH